MHTTKWGEEKNNNQFLPKNWLNLLYTYANSDPTVLEKKKFLKIN